MQFQSRKANNYRKLNLVNQRKVEFLTFLCLQSNNFVTLQIATTQAFYSGSPADCAIFFIIDVVD